jgi:YVTN family beta-propeller protein
VQKSLPRYALWACCQALALGGCSGALPEPLEGNAVWVVNGGSGTLSVIDAERQQLLGTVGLGGARYPHHINMSPDRAWLVVSAPGMDLSQGHAHHGAGKGSLLLLEATTGALRTSRELEVGAHNGAFSPDGSEVWAAQMDHSGKVLVLDARTLRTRATLPAGDTPGEVTFAPNGRYAFVANGGSHDMTIIEVASKSVVRTLPVGRGPVGAWPGGDGFMYVDNEADKSLTAIDASSLEVVRTYALGFTPAMVATAPNGELWVADADNGRVVIFAAGSTQQAGEVATGAGAHGVAFSADGATAYVTNQQAGTLSLIDVATRTERKELRVGDKPNGLLFRAH